MFTRKKKVIGPVISGDLIQDPGCDIAGRRCNGRPRRQPDPYAVELDGDWSTIWACDPCAQDQADDA